MTHADASTPVALDKAAAEKNMGEIKTSARCKRIVGIWATVIGGALLTTAEAVTGILRVDSPDVTVAPMKLPLDQVNVLTSGTAALPAHIIPVDIECKGQATFTGYITLDDVITGDLKARWGLMYED